MKFNIENEYTWKDIDYILDKEFIIIEISIDIKISRYNETISCIKLLSLFILWNNKRKSEVDNIIYCKSIEWSKRISFSYSYFIDLK